MIPQSTVTRELAGEHETKGRKVPRVIARLQVSLLLSHDCLTDNFSWLTGGGYESCPVATIKQHMPPLKLVCVSHVGCSECVMLCHVFFQSRNAGRGMGTNQRGFSQANSWNATGLRRILRHVTPSIFSAALLLTLTPILTATLLTAGTSTAAALAGSEGAWSSPQSIDVSTNQHMPYSISCPSASFCAVVDNSGYAITYNGSSWSSPEDIDGTNMLLSVSCPSASFCVAVDNKGNVLTYSGSSWSSPEPVDPHGFGGTIQAGPFVSCSSASFCVAIDEDGNAYTYDGSSWSGPNNFDRSDGYLTSVSCSSASFCAATEFYGFIFTYDGSSWSLPQYVGFGQRGVSCASSNFCVAWGIDNNILTYDGSSWSLPQSIDSAGDNPISISCPTTSFCAAVDDQGNVLTDSSGTWSSPQDIDGANFVSELGQAFISASCPTASFCAAVDEEGNVFTYNGSAWGSPQNIEQVRDNLVSVSCPSRSFCDAVDAQGNVLNYNGSSWFTPVNIVGATGLTSVACPSWKFCVAVGEGAFYDDLEFPLPGEWGLVKDIDPGNMLTSVSCAENALSLSASFCAAVDYSGNASIGTYSSNSDTWSWPPFANIDGTNSLSSVSCPSVGFCVRGR